MVELRKRKAPEPAPLPPTKKKTSTVKAAVNKAKEVVTGKPAEPATNEPTAAGDPTVGSSITLEGFGGEVETNDGEKTTFKKLVDDSKSGVVLFTYPKASTPGCTNQACLFRDEYTPLTATGLSIYGLSRDSPKSNTTFKTKQKLPYSLLCDPSSTLIAAIGMKKSASSTTRGVFVVEKTGKVLVAEAGGPAATVAAVKKIVVDSGAVAGTGSSEEKTGGEEAVALDGAAAPVAATAMNGEVGNKEDKETADVAADVADSAAKIDSNTPVPT